MGLYRVSQSEMTKVIWVWQIEICKIYFVWMWFWHSEVGAFEFHQPILVSFCEMDCQKPNFSLIFGILPMGGCWCQPMLFFWKLVVKLECPNLRMSKSPSNKIWYPYFSLSDSNYFCQFTKVLITYQCSDKYFKT